MADTQKHAAPKNPGGRPHRDDDARQVKIYLSAEAKAMAETLAAQLTRGNVSALVERLIREAAGR